MHRDLQDPKALLDQQAVRELRDGLELREYKEYRDSQELQGLTGLADVRELQVIYVSSYTEHDSVLYLDCIF